MILKEPSQGCEVIYGINFLIYETYMYKTFKNNKCVNLNRQNKYGYRISQNYK